MCLVRHRVADRVKPTSNSTTNQTAEAPEVPDRQMDVDSPVVPKRNIEAQEAYRADYVRMSWKRGIEANDNLTEEHESGKKRLGCLHLAGKTSISVSEH